MKRLVALTVDWRVTDELREANESDSPDEMAWYSREDVKRLIGKIYDKISYGMERSEAKYEIEDFLGKCLEAEEEEEP